MLKNIPIYAAERQDLFIQYSTLTKADSDEFRLTWSQCSHSDKKTYLASCGKKSGFIALLHRPHIYTSHRLMMLNAKHCMRLFMIQPSLRELVSLSQSLRLN